MFKKIKGFEIFFLDKNKFYKVIIYIFCIYILIIELKKKYICVNKK